MRIIYIFLIAVLLLVPNINGFSLPRNPDNFYTLRGEYNSYGQIILKGKNIYVFVVGIPEGYYYIVNNNICLKKIKVYPSLVPFGDKYKYFTYGEVKFNYGGKLSNKWKIVDIKNINCKKGLIKEVELR